MKAKLLYILIVIFVSPQFVMATKSGKKCVSALSTQKKNRKGIITEPEGKKFRLNYKIDGKSKSIAGFMQPEWEAKILFTKNKLGEAGQTQTLKSIVDHFGASLVFAGKRSHWGYKKGDFSQRAFWRSKDFGGFYAESLASEKDFYHNGHKVEEDSNYEVRSRGDEDSEVKQTGWTVTLEGQRIYTQATNKTSEDLVMRHIVGYQYEQGLYYDTVNGELAKQGVALRIKQWSPISENEIGEAQAQTLFVKIDRDTKLDLFNLYSEELLHHRDEYQIKIPLKTSTKEINEIMKALLSHVGVAVPAEPILLSKTVNNYRYGINLMYRPEGSRGNKDYKFGFITVDRFTLDIDKQEFQQIEVEIFPQYINTYARQSGSFDEFWDHLLASLPKGSQVKTTETPKYLQEP